MRGGREYLRTAFRRLRGTDSGAGVHLSVYENRRKIIAAILQIRSWTYCA